MKMPLVLVSGLLSNASLWQYQVNYLNPIAAIHVVSPTQSRPEQMVKAILDAAPATFALAGHSMGGWLCLEVMRAAPSRVSRLCLLNTTARRDSAEKKARRREMMLKAKDGHFPEIVEEIAAAFVSNPSVQKDVEKMFLEVGREAFVRQEEAMLQRDESESILSTIACPTLVIHASEDRNFSLEEHEELVSRIPHAKLAVVEGSGHMSPLEAPQAVTDLLRDWLTSP